MDRIFVYDQEGGRSFDFNSLAKSAMLGLAWLEQDLAGASLTVVAGLSASAPGGLGVTVGSGRVYALANTDTNPVAGGDLAEDTTQIMQQGNTAALSLLLSTAGLAAGQSRWALIEAGFVQNDVIAPNDPNNGLLDFFNVANILQPLIGEGGNNLTLPTMRQGQCNIKIVYGNVATTGAEAPPQPDTGYVPLYLVDLAFGQTTVTGGQILVSGPSVGTGVPSNYPDAPFLAGLLGDYSAAASHHKGKPGHAAKVALASEVQGLLPLLNIAAQPTYGFDAATPPGAPISLRTGDRLNVTFTAVTAVALHCATLAGQVYKVRVVISANNTLDTNVYFFPNDTTYSGKFNMWCIEATDVGGIAPTYVASNAAGIVLSAYDTFVFDLFSGPSGSDTINDIGPAMLEFDVSTYTSAKMIRYTGGIFGGGAAGFTNWNDTSTIWTSLGTLKVWNGSGGGSPPAIPAGNLATLSGVVLIERLF